MVRELVHTATLHVRGVEIRMHSSYSVDIDLLQPADGFRLTVPLDARTVSLIPLDAEFSFRIDEQPIVTGFVDRLVETEDNRLEVVARCRTGRLVDESVDGAGFAIARDTRLLDAIRRVVGRWYQRIELAASERSRRLPHRVKCEAGMSRMEALDRVLEPLRLMSWADGRDSTLVVGRPDYQQTPAFVFVYGGATSNVLALRRTRSTENRYRDYEVGGTSNTGNRLGTARDKSSDFLHEKRLYVPREPDSDMTAAERARRIMAQANAGGYELQVHAPGHGQVQPGDTSPTIYRPDLVARCVRQARASAIDDTRVTLYDQPAYITRTTYTADASGTRTTLSLVPLETELV